MRQTVCLSLSYSLSLKEILSFCPALWSRVLTCYPPRFVLFFVTEDTLPPALILKTGFGKHNHPITCFHLHFQFEQRNAKWKHHKFEGKKAKILQRKWFYIDCGGKVGVSKCTSTWASSPLRRLWRKKTWDILWNLCQITTLNKYKCYTSIVFPDVHWFNFIIPLHHHLLRQSNGIWLENWCRPK